MTCLCVCKQVLQLLWMVKSYYPRATIEECKKALQFTVSESDECDAVLSITVPPHINIYFLALSLVHTVHIMCQHQAPVLCPVSCL